MVEKKKIIWKRWYMIVAYCFFGLLILSAILPDTETNNSNQENLALNDNSINQNQLQKVFEGTNVYRFRILKGDEANLILMDSSSEDNLTKGYTIAIENTCGITIPDNYFMLFDTGTLLVIDANTYEVKCDYLNLEDSKTGQPVPQDELSEFISELEKQEKQTTPQTTTSTNTATMGEKNALSSALSYLRYSAFSYSGLIDQLEYEGYSYQEAKYGVDNCGADWNEQATLKAQVYLDTMPFSRQGLIDQLVYEGFTQSQAEYGVNAVGY